MVRLNFSVFFAGVLLFAVAESISGPHVADVNILLPPKMTQPVEYRLQGTDGCFKWFLSCPFNIRFILLFFAAFLRVWKLN